jgi:hypothetical protein
MARGDDAGNLKLAVVVWVDEIFGPSQPPLKPTSKDERGLENDNTGRLLCPGEYKWDDAELVKCFDFNNDPDQGLAGYYVPLFGRATRIF